MRRCVVAVVRDVPLLQRGMCHDRCEACATAAVDRQTNDDERDERRKEEDRDSKTVRYHNLYREEEGLRGALQLTNKEGEVDGASQLQEEKGLMGDQERGKGEFCGARIQKRMRVVRVNWGGYFVHLTK